MIQQVEYEPTKFISWMLRGPNLSQVMYRKTLVKTQKALALVIFGYSAMFLYLVLVGLMAGTSSPLLLLLAVLAPLVTIFGLMLAITLGLLVVKPLQAREIKQSREIFSSHPATKIAILGSYGKTTMKELLSTVLSEGKRVTSTPGNKNVSISHARWAKTLSAEEEILLVEFGEAKPGDVGSFSKNTMPDYAVVTGLAPNHLDGYKTLKAVEADLLSITKYVDANKIYFSPGFKSSLGKNDYTFYDEDGLADVKISHVELSLEGMSFIATIAGKQKIKLKTMLIGKHLLGPLAICISLALRFGLTTEQIIQGIAQTRPFEHRLQPRNIGGAWIIDDTYNGSLEGFRAGLKFLKELDMKKKIYVTPGLVDQGEETENVHKKIGELIADCNPNKVILMKNSVTDYITHSLDASGYQGVLEIRDDPLEFYTNLEHTLAAGDVVLMQNDWTDNYY